MGSIFFIGLTLFLFSTNFSWATLEPPQALSDYPPPMVTCCSIILKTEPTPSALGQSLSERDKNIRIFPELNCQLLNALDLGKLNELSQFRAAYQRIYKEIYKKASENLDLASASLRSFENFNDQFKGKVLTQEKLNFILTQYLALKNRKTVSPLRQLDTECFAIKTKLNELQDEQNAQSPQVSAPVECYNRERCRQFGAGGALAGCCTGCIIGVLHSGNLTPALGGAIGGFTGAGVGCVAGGAFVCVINTLASITGCVADQCKAIQQSCPRALKRWYLKKRLSAIQAQMSDPKLIQDSLELFPVWQFEKDSKFIEDLKNIRRLNDPVMNLVFDYFKYTQSDPQMNGESPI